VGEPLKLPALERVNPVGSTGTGRGDGSDVYSPVKQQLHPQRRPDAAPSDFSDLAQAPGAEAVANSVRTSWRCRLT